MEQRDHWKDPELRDQHERILDLADRLMALHLNPAEVIRKIVEAEEAFCATPREKVFDEGARVAGFLARPPAGVNPFAAPSVAGALHFTVHISLGKDELGLARNPHFHDRKAFENFLGAIRDAVPRVAPHRPVNPFGQDVRREMRKKALERIRKAEGILRKLRPRRVEDEQQIFDRLVKLGYKSEKAGRWTPVIVRAGETRRRGPFPIAAAAAAMADVEQRTLPALRKDTRNSS